MKNKNARRTAVNKFAVSAPRYFFLISLSYIFLYQIAYMLSQAFKPDNQIYDPSVVWIPKSFTLDNIKLACANMDYVKSLCATLFIVVGSGLLEVLTCMLMAYGLARFKFKGNRILFGLVILTIVVPPQMIIIPTSMNFSHLDFLGVLFGFFKLTGIDLRPNILDTPLTFYLPALFGVGLRSGLFIFIYRQFLSKIPYELEEAAYIDGAGPFKTFASIIIPSSGVVIFTVIIFSVIWHYNDYYLSDMYLTENRTLAVSLANITSTVSTQLVEEDYKRVLQMAGSLVFIAPVLIMYMILQKKFVQNIDRVGIVG